jgi:protein-tyrosine phosphatase
VIDLNSDAPILVSGLFSEIVPRLYMGECPRHVQSLKTIEKFTHIINLYPWQPYERHRHQIYTEAWMLDSNDLPDTTILYSLANHINHAIEHQGMVLVHCQQGINRSGLVTGLALYEQGFSAKDAIALMRKRRFAGVLSNKVFEAWLLALDAGA